MQSAFIRQNKKTSGFEEMVRRSSQKRKQGASWSLVPTARACCLSVPFPQSPCPLPSSSNHTHLSTPFLSLLPSLRPSGRNCTRHSFTSSPARSWNLFLQDQLPKELVKTEISWLRMGGEGNRIWRKVTAWALCGYHVPGPVWAGRE